MTGRDAALRRYGIDLTRTVVVLLITTACGGAPAPPPVSGLHPLAVTAEVPARAALTNLLLYVPPDSPPGARLPTILYLHGGSQRGTDLEKLKSYGLPRLLSQGAELPFVVIAPQLPEGEIWSDADLLVSLIDELGRDLPIDSERIYVTGMSMGGRGAWYLAFRYPDRFAAIAPVAAFQPIIHWALSGRLRFVPVLAYHGDQDDLAPYADAVRMNEAMRTAGGQSELRVLEGRDHFIADAFEDSELYRWLLSHRIKETG